MKAQYGIDAPKVVRNLFLFSLLAFVLFGLSFQISSKIWFWIASLYTGLMGVSLFAMGWWMVFSTKIFKPRLIKELIDNFNLKGDETVLDAGCGSGLFLIGAAKKLPHGKAHGVDLWFSKDQSENKKEKTVSNAIAENVKDRVEVHTSDIRILSFPDQSFDVVFSSLAIHNIPDQKGRSQALSEMVRVLKPGGKLCIVDIHFGKEYAVFFEHMDQMEISCFSTKYAYCLPMKIIQGKKHERSLSARA